MGLNIARGATTPARLFGALFCLGVIGHVLTQSPMLYSALGPATIPAWALSVVAGGLFWAFALALFGDIARISPLHLAPTLILLAIGVATRLAPEAAQGLWLFHNLFNAGLMLHVLVIIAGGWRGDLVEARRRLRGPLLAAAAVYALAVVAVQSVELFSQPATGLSLLAALGLLAMGLAGGAVFLSAEPALFARAGPVRPRKASSNSDAALLDRLIEAVDTRRLWREEGLTIGALAAHLGAPEHHVRRVINEGLGYRNFIAFIGERRIAAAKAALGDAAQSRTSIATIAFDVGFGSIGPFNRAFREATGQTPTAWRKAAFATAPIVEAGRS
jgi:AraC-like DNA-binding protein